MASQVTYGELKDAARSQGVDPEQSYEGLREEIEIYTCKWCNDEYLHDLHDEFCSDGCQVHYINEHHR